MKIEFYEDWMKPQIAKLFSMQYGISEQDFSRLIDNFYDLPFQKDKCIRIVAREEKTIIGFQSFFYWPYTLYGQIFNSYQSGNSLVHPDHRGKGVFQELLNYLDNHKDELKIDFLVGFPIDVSVGSLIRNKWQNIFNLQWYVKFNNPLSFLFPLNTSDLKKYFPNRNLFLQNSSKQIKILNAQEFSDWRSTHYDKEKYFSFYYTENKNEFLLKLKINVRKKIIKELIIGDVITTSYNASFIENAIDAFLKTAKKVKSISLVSIALNEKSCNGLVKSLLYKKFKTIDKQIYFCIKPFSTNDLIANPSNWAVYRGDIDTW